MQCFVFFTSYWKILKDSPSSLPQPCKSSPNVNLDHATLLLSPSYAGDKPQMLSLSWRPVRYQVLWKLHPPLILTTLNYDFLFCKLIKLSHSPLFVCLLVLFVIRPHCLVLVALYDELEYHHLVKTCLPSPDFIISSSELFLRLLNLLSNLPREGTRAHLVLSPAFGTHKVLSNYYF